MERKGSIKEEILKDEKLKRNAELMSSNLNDIKERFKAKDDDMEQMILSSDETFEKYKTEYSKSLEVIIPEVEVLGSSVITTKALMNITEQGKYLIGQELNIDLIKAFSEAISEVQTVVAVGPHCRQVKVGDVVSIRMSDFTRIQNPNSVQSREITEIPLEEIENVSYLCIHESNIRYIKKDKGYNDRRKN